MERKKVDPVDQSWMDALAILAQAQAMPMGAERIAAVSRQNSIRRGPPAAGKGSRDSRPKDGK